MNRQEKIDFIVDNYPEFDEETPQEWKDNLRNKLQDLSNERINEEFEWTDYLLDKLLEED